MLLFKILAKIFMQKFVSEMYDQAFGHNIKRPLSEKKTGFYSDGGLFSLLLKA